MDRITVIFGFDFPPEGKNFIEIFLYQPMVAKIILIASKKSDALPSPCVTMDGSKTGSEGILTRLLTQIDTPYFLVLHRREAIQLGPKSLERLVEVAMTAKAGMVYSDYYEVVQGEMREHPLNDYQLGSIRDDFEFGAVTLFSTAASRQALSDSNPPCYSFPAGFYDLRLKVSLAYPLFHIREFLYTVLESQAQDEQHFAYLNPRHRSYQEEMEGIVTGHLRRLQAFLEPEFANIPPPTHNFPVEASVVIPVRNRVHTIAEAVESALSQKTDFPFNVLVIDNHSSNGTTAKLEEISKQQPRLRHFMPVRCDLSIGGCWNEAIYSEYCGRFAVQLDSDDLYSSPYTLQPIIDLLRRGKFAMVIGAYTLVNAQLEEIAPGLIDHREWTEENGRNNALRINGLGAPRAFNTEIVRQFGFLNVGYGEDYAMALRISRDYRIGRIYDNLYLCRRWEGNSDAALSVSQRNRFDAFKDQIRTLEIMARQEINKRQKVNSEQ